MTKSGSFESSKPYLSIYNFKKQQNTTFNIYQDVLKSGDLLHKRGLDDSQSHTTVDKNQLHPPIDKTHSDTPLETTHI